MKKLAIILSILSLSILTGCGTEETNTPESKKEPTTTIEAKGNLKDFMNGKIGTNLKCEFNHEIAKNNSLKVITYISGKKVRVDYKMEGPLSGTNAGQKNLHILTDGEYSYIWGESLLGEMMQGMKQKIDYHEDGTRNFDNQGMADSMINYEAQLAGCKKWNPDHSLFEIPKDIPFMDLNNINDVFGLPPEHSPKETSDLSATYGICNMLPTNQQEKCKEEMNC